MAGLKILFRGGLRPGVAIGLIHDLPLAGNDVNGSSVMALLLDLVGRTAKGSRRHEAAQLIRAHE